MDKTNTSKEIMNRWPRDRYTGSGGGLYTGSCDSPYFSNWPPPHIFIQELRKRNMNDIVEYLLSKGFLDYIK